jgi:hypothetical protein
LPLSTMCRLDFGALPTVVFFGFVIFFHWSSTFLSSR